MKIGTLSLAVVVVLATNSACALTPAQISAARNQANLKEVWLSGSSSLTISAFEAFK